MESRAKILGHGAHPILIVFPLGLLSTAVIFDVIYLITGNGRWSDVAYYMIAAGLIGGLAAAVPGFIDWLAIPKGTRARRVGLIHGVGNDIVLLLFFVSWWLRRGAAPAGAPDFPGDPPTLALVMSFAGAELAMATDWQGGELVERHRMDVHEGAHLDAPNTLSGRPASERE
ncbi:MAG TPA: DUF2231 domain-containing protein [Pyrinomonadaceae bacterium]|nr:DUF2231 domain-containing protein [Pyrinomonadaceae bacterium]